VTKNIERARSFVEEALAIDAEEAKEAKGAGIGYYARMLVQVTMPHSKPDTNEVERRNGQLVLTMIAPSKIGLPYGTYPRLLMSWLTTEAVRTKSPQLELGDSLSVFMHRLGLDVTGGEKGTIGVLRRQSQRLFASSISWSWEGKSGAMAMGGMTPIEEARLWWDPKRPEQVSLWRSTVRLTDRFFREIVERPVPVNMEALKVLAAQRSPMALDIYSWLTYRMSYLRKDQLIPWELLQMQFGGDYGRTRKFKEKFLERLKLVQTVYREAKISLDPDGLILSPSPTHVAKVQRRWKPRQAGTGEAIESQG
jgi:hypothetical protein